MVLSIPIKPVPNQRLNVVLNNQNCTIIILSRGGNCYLSLLVDNNMILQNRKLTISPVVPYAYMQEVFNGNLILVNNDLNTDINPSYKLFGSKQSLIYYTLDEVS